MSKFSISTLLNNCTHDKTTLRVRTLASVIAFHAYDTSIIKKIAITVFMIKSTSYQKQQMQYSISYKMREVKTIECYISSICFYK